MTVNQLRLSLVIPAYNEARHLRQCLEAVAAQTLMPYEVIVVDNNSTDHTARIAEEFPFVTLMHEKRQGVVFARDTGFDAAQGDIIGRIDADTLLTPSWTETVLGLFAEDAELDGLSGSAHFYDIAFPVLLNSVDLAFRRWFAYVFEKTDDVFMQGANMAVRRSAWRHVRGVLCRSGNLHEDGDLSIHMQEYGHKVRFKEEAVAKLSARRIDVSFAKFVHYAHMSPHTYALHDLKCRWHMYPVVVLSIIAYGVVRFLHRGFDAETGDFSVARVFASSQASGRIDPTTVP